jgi:hypothetical protein
MEFLKADKEEREAGHKDLLAKMGTWNGGISNKTR